MGLTALRQRWKLARKKCDSAFYFISAQECRQLEYSQPVPDRALINHVLIKINTTREDICDIRCFTEPNCLSFNVGPLEDSDQYLCEISDSNGALSPGNLVPRKGFTYQGTKVFLEFDLYPSKRQYGSKLSYHYWLKTSPGRKANEGREVKEYMSFVGTQ